jgi:hypothetical protein
MQVMLDPCFPGWEPVTLRRRQPAYLINLLQVLLVLDVSAVMPSEYIRLFAVDQVGHRLDPVRALDGCQPSVLCILNNLEHVTTF